MDTVLEKSAGEAKRVGWLELFYDLAFVALIAQLTYVVADHHSTFIDLFLVGLVGYMIFIAWIGTTIDRNLQDRETRRDQLLIQLQMILAFLMSLSLGGVFEGDLLPFFVSFALVRTVQLYMRHTYYREYPERAPKTRNVFWGSVIATALWFVAGFVALPYGFVIAIAALCTDIFSPQTRGKGNSIVLLNIDHLKERLGLFLILVMGESMLVVALANTAAEAAAPQPITVISGIVLMIALWWTYFGFLDFCAKGKRPNNMLVFLHAHAFLFGGVILLAAAYKNFLKHDTLVTTDQILLTAGVLLTGGMLVMIRGTLMGKHTLRTGAIRAMVIGTPVIGYIGYLTESIVYATALMTLWIVLLALYDEWSRYRASIQVH